MSDLTSLSDASDQDDPFLAELPEFNYLPDDDPLVPFSPSELLDSAEAAPVATSYESAAGWSWYDAALIAVERTNDASGVIGYAIGCVDLYSNVHSGDLGGSYLEIDHFDDIDEAAAFYHELQGEIHNQQLLPFHLADFAGEKAQERAVTHGQPAPTWRVSSPAEYAAYEQMRSLDMPDERDTPPDEALDPLLVTARELGGAVTKLQQSDIDTPTSRALRDIGIAADGFDPNTNPPPFIDPETGIAYWIGVFQPDKDDPANCVTSVLSVGRDPETGEVEAQLAPCVPGDWDKAYGAAEYLLGIVEKDGIDHGLDAAEGMALASDQRALWDEKRGIPLEQNAAENLADYTRDQWEIDL